MLSVDNLEVLLKNLGFSKEGVWYKKTINDATLEVNLQTQVIQYPESKGLVVNERQICNFEAKENFVVLECVNRLLEKGYSPANIELEPKWKLGRGASGGRADVLVRDRQRRPLLLIECKTAGSEFNRAWRKTLIDGDQLFSYAQQINETSFLCLYSSSLNGDTVEYVNHVIAHQDNKKYLAENPLLKSFHTASDVKERYAVWRETYKLDFSTKGIFENNIHAYQIGKDKYTLDDLAAISAVDQQKKYHEFATILRQHNVSARENAFDKLVNLFLCKLVDEIEHPSDLKFYWKGVAYDTHFELMDRLQQLYQAGMGKFLGEDITYINQYDVNNALRFIRQNPDATQRAVWNLFIQQKFFTNNDFSLIDVHNEKLFYQNADVLVKILQMWQDIRLTHPDGHNQFLGDMFEGFLDQGIKQSEGQFFTPMPICRFILMSLPLDDIIHRNVAPPKAIDYACGAGHFLTELALQIKPLVESIKEGVDLASYHKAMFGIEKEYRLSKVAKVSAFMYGQQEINICYGDGLINHHEAFPEITDGTFDLLVANPPFSVAGFLETLPEIERSKYVLSDAITDIEAAKSIEVFFVERAKQLLKNDGIAAIILPSSLLTNGLTAYVRAREILIQFFDIVAIVEFGSGTFGETGTNTVTAFLRRKKTMPDTAIHFSERVDDWFNPSTAREHEQIIYGDENILGKYASHIQVPLQDYKTLLSGDAKGPWRKYLSHTYQKKFETSSEYKDVVKTKRYKQMHKGEKSSELNKAFLEFVRIFERDKLYHFALAFSQPNPVLIIRSPSGTTEIKDFLGYEWSKAKGNQGIKLTKDEKGNHLTPLYDESNRNNPSKLNTLISANFKGLLSELPAEMRETTALIPLVEMLDFASADFDKRIAIISKSTVTLSSRYPMRRLDAVAKIANGATPDTKNKAFWENGTIYWATLTDTKNKYLDSTKKKITELALRRLNLLPVGTVIFSSRATIGQVTIARVETTTNQGFKNFICNEKILHNEYLYYLLQFLRPVFERLVPSGSKYKELNSGVIGAFKIPVPEDVSEQIKIAQECSRIDDSAAEILSNGVPLAQVQKEIERKKSEIFQAFVDLASGPG